MVDKKNVYVVDDNADVRRATYRLLDNAGFAPRVFVCGQDFLDALDEIEAGCVLLDLLLPDLDGAEVMRRARESEARFQFVVFSGHADVASAVEVMRLGASDFLEKPFSEETLLTALENAFARLDRALALFDQRDHALQMIAGLTRREHDVLIGLLGGMSNKQVGGWLGLSPRTVEMHRANMMEKLHARTLSDALRIALAGGLSPDAAMFEGTHRMP